MKTSNLKFTTNVVLYIFIIFSLIVISKNTIRNIKNLYSSERLIITPMTCFADLIY
jgi:hypothetical protein